MLICDHVPSLNDDKKLDDVYEKCSSQAGFLYLGLNYQTNLDMLTHDSCLSLNDDKKSFSA